MIFFVFRYARFLNGADCKGTNFFVSRKFFSSFLRTFFHRGGALNSPFPKRVAKVRFFPLPPNLFQDFFDFFSEKAVQIAGRDASRAATEPTQNDATAEKWRQKSGGRKGAGGKLLQERGDRKSGAGLRSGGSHGSHDWCPTIRCGLALLRKNIYLLYNSDSRKLSRPVQPVLGIPEKW